MGGGSVLTLEIEILTIGDWRWIFDLYMDVEKLLVVVVYL